MKTSCLHGFDFSFGRTLTARDNGAGVSHAFALRGRGPGNKCGDGLFDFGLDKFGGLIFFGAADFPDKDYALGFRVFVEHFNNIEMSEPVDRIAPDALGDLSFDELPAFEPYGGPQDLVAADFDEDGTMDLAITRPAAEEVTLFLGRP